MGVPQSTCTRIKLQDLWNLHTIFHGYASPLASMKTRPAGPEIRTSPRPSAHPTNPQIRLFLNAIDARGNTSSSHHFPRNKIRAAPGLPLAASLQAMPRLHELLAGFLFPCRAGFVRSGSSKGSAAKQIGCRESLNPDEGPGRNLGGLDDVLMRQPRSRKRRRWLAIPIPCLRGCSELCRLGLNSIAIRRYRFLGNSASLGYFAACCSLPDGNEQLRMLWNRIVAWSVALCSEA
ncbi:hypothetical protein GGI42DRAFT_43162 [Trichoderma sp. SZMC 28013]